MTACQATVIRGTRTSPPEYCETEVEIEGEEFCYFHREDIWDRADEAYDRLTEPGLCEYR